MKQTVIKEDASRIVYEAIDGQLFDSKEECEKYEKSAMGVLKGRFKKLIVGIHNAWDLLRGYDDNEVYILKLKNQQDADTVWQLFYLENPYYLERNRKDRDEYIEKWEKWTENALQEGNFLLMGINCDDCLYFLGDVYSIINGITDACGITDTSKENTETGNKEYYGN